MATLDLQIDASTDDTYEAESGGSSGGTDAHILVDSWTSIFGRYWGGIRFHSASLPPSGATITAAYIELYIYSTSWEDANFDIYNEVGAAPVTFSTGTYPVTSRTRGAVSVAWVADSLGTGWKTSPSIVTVIQEIVDSYSPTAIVFILKPKTDVGRQFRARTYDQTPLGTLSAKLHLEWTEDGAPQTINATPVTIPLVVPAPTVTTGPATISPSPVAISTQVPTATLTPAPISLSPAPVAISFVVPVATLTVGTVTMAPAPVTLPLVIPAVTVIGGGLTTILAAPVAVPLVVPVPTLTPSPVTLVAAPVTILLVVPVPSISAALTLLLAPVTIPLVVPTPSLSKGAITIAAAPVVITFVVPNQVISTATGAVFIQFGNIVRSINRTDFPTSALLYFEAMLKASTPAVTAKVYLYNVTDGLIVPGSEVSTTSITPVRVRSGAITLSGVKDYRVEFGGDIGGLYNCYSADVLVGSS